MTSCSSGRKATRSGTQQENNCKISFAGRCGNTDNFIQCCVRVEHRKDGGFLLSQTEFVDELREIQIPSRRRKEKDSPVSRQEQTELIGLLGGLGWKREQTGPQYSAAAGLQRSRIEQATVQEMSEANLLHQQVKKESGQAMRIFSFLTEEELALIGWDDAALQNRIDGRNTKRVPLHMPFREGFAGRGIFDVCDQLEKWPNGQSVS